MTTIVAELPAGLSVRRGGRTSVWTGVGSAAVVAVLAYLPYAVTTSVTGTIVTFLELLVMSTMWNLLAGYAGLVSIGTTIAAVIKRHFFMVPFPRSAQAATGPR